MALNVEVRTVDPQPIISITKRVKVDELNDHIWNSLATLYAGLEAQGEKPVGAPFGLYHGPINGEDDGPIEVCVPVRRRPATQGEVTARELPGGRVASVLLRGDQCEFPAVLEGYDVTHDWIQQNGYEPADSPREIWHSEPGEDGRMEIAWPFHERGQI